MKEHKRIRMSLPYSHLVSKNMLVVFLVIATGILLSYSSSNNLADQQQNSSVAQLESSTVAMNGADDWIGDAKVTVPNFDGFSEDKCLYSL